MKKAKRKSKTRNNKPAQKQRLPLKLIPRSVYLGTETLEAYSMRKVAAEKEQRSKNQAKRERYSKEIERAQRYLADIRLKDYWLNQAKPVFFQETVADWRNIRFEWPKDKAFFYAVMLLCADSASKIHLLPESFKQTKAYEQNKNVTWVWLFDYAGQLMTYIEADLEQKGLLQKKESKQKSRGRPPGRPKLTEEEVESRKAIVEGWRRAKGAGISKVDYLADINKNGVEYSNGLLYKIKEEVTVSRLEKYKNYFSQERHRNHKNP